MTLGPLKMKRILSFEVLEISLLLGVKMLKTKILDISAAEVSVHIYLE